jgi:hypothetical protein
VGRCAARRCALRNLVAELTGHPELAMR